MDSSFESDISVENSFSAGNVSPKNEPLDVINAENDLSLTGAFSSVGVLSAETNVGDLNKAPLIFNGKYFKIIKRIGETDHQKAANGIIAACQLCIQKKTIKGSLKITSNFLQHLRSRHRSHYAEYVIEKKNKNKHCRKDPNRKSNCDDNLDNRRGDSSRAGPSSPKSRESASCTSSVMEPSSLNEPPLILNGKYFKIVKEFIQISKTDNQKCVPGVIAACQLCVENKTIKGSLKITSNFLQHLKSQHLSHYEEYLVDKQSRGRYSRKLEDWESEIEKKPFELDVDSNSQFGNNAEDLNFVPPSIPKREMDIIDSNSNESELMETSSVSSSCAFEENDQSEVLNHAPSILDGKYFKIIKQIKETNHQKTAGGVIAACQLCAQNKTIKGSLKITSNFLRHFKFKHRSHYEEYLLEKNNGREDSRKERVTQSAFDRKVLKFVADNHLPFSIVEHSSFLGLFEGLDVQVCSRKHITTLLDTKYSFMIMKLRDTLSNVSSICTTAHVWCNRGKSFFGYACHWLYPDFSRHSAVLAFWQLTDEDVFDKIPDRINQIHADFGIAEEKIIYTLTENRSNFIKSFKELRLRDNYEQREYVSESLDSDIDSEVVSKLFHRLQEHKTCGSHTLSLLATTDFIDILMTNKEVHEQHQNSLNRCVGIWNKCKKSGTAEIIEKHLNCSLKTPTTEWISLFDSLRGLLRHKDKLDNLCLSLEAAKLDFSEIQYVEEYCVLMEPIAEGLEFLQQEANMYYGYFLPTIISIKVKWRKLYESGNLKYLNEIAQQMEKALVKRFQDFFEMAPECSDSLVAAISCPVIKIRFIKALSQTAPNVSAEDTQSLFTLHVKEYQSENVPMQVPPSPETSSVHSFFDFESPEETIKQEVDPLFNARREVMRYLQDENCSLSCLNRYPAIKKVFLRYNTPLPSIAPIKKLFSYADDIVTDEHFEKLVTLKANKII